MTWLRDLGYRLDLWCERAFFGGPADYRRRPDPDTWPATRTKP